MYISSFHLAWVQLRAQRIGAAVLTSEQLGILRGALVLGKKRMASMLPSLSERKSA